VAASAPAIVSRPRAVQAAGDVPKPVPVGFDISWPQCGSGYPPKPYSIAVVGVNDGQAFTFNPCLASEVRWAGPLLQLYMNINSPAVLDVSTMIGPAGHCPADDWGCMAYNFGYNDAANTFAIAARLGAASHTWWIDVETGGPCGAFPTGGASYWSCNTVLNSLTVQGALDALRARHVTAGVYSTGYQWQLITGGYVPQGGVLATWIAGVDPAIGAVACADRAVANASPSLLQTSNPATYDVNLGC
jgi:hypothetical protein